MNALRNHLIGSFEQRAIHTAYLRRVERARTRQADRSLIHAAHHTPPLQLFVR
jgi:hypothetical protein